MIETISLLPGITLRVCRDTRFKQGCLSFQLVRQMDASEAALNALLPSVLLRGTRNCPDLKSITEHLDELYGASVSPLVRRVGDYQTTGLYCGFMDDRFALPGDQVFRPMLAFLEELLLDSPLENGGFLPSFVESEKRNLIATIESQKNDKRAYAGSQMIKKMCQADSFGIPRLGTIAHVEAITPQTLYAHYRKILRESPVNLLYVGSAKPEAVAALLPPVPTEDFYRIRLTGDGPVDVEALEAEFSDFPNLELRDKTVLRDRMERTDNLSSRVWTPVRVKTTSY